MVIQEHRKVIEMPTNSAKHKLFPQKQKTSQKKRKGNAAGKGGICAEIKNGAGAVHETRTARCIIYRGMQMRRFVSENVVN